MEFLNPSGLYALTLLPLLFLPYLIRRRHRVVFSSLLLLKEFTGRSSSNWTRIRLPVLFFLQLLILLLLAFGMGNPVLTATSPKKIAVIMDNSASMQAREEGRSRFELAGEKVMELLERLGPDAKVDMYITVPRLKSVGRDLTTQGAKALVKSARPYDVAESSKAYERFLADQMGNDLYDRTYFFTDYTLRKRLGRVEIVTLGSPRGNMAMTSFVLHRSFSTERVRAVMRITNFGSKTRTVKLALKGEGKRLAVESQTVPPQETATVVIEGLPYRSFYEVRLMVNDAFPLDNVRYGMLPRLDGNSILAISPRGAVFESLKTIPGLKVKVVPPRGYQESHGEGQGLEIFHYSAPRVLPENDTLFILPPENNPLVTLGKSVIRPAITDWREPHPLTRYVKFSLFQPSYGRLLVPPMTGNHIIEGPEGPLAVVIKRNGFRYLVLGFDPFPYLGRSNLPMSVFTLNVLNWFFGGNGAFTTLTGEPLRLPGHPRATLRGPEGVRVETDEGSTRFTDTFYQGIYRLGEGQNEQLRAVNFDDARESNLAESRELKMVSAEKGQKTPASGFSLWPYLVWTSLIFLLLEWFLNPAGAAQSVSVARSMSEGGK